MTFNKELLAETIALIDQADKPFIIDQLMHGKYDKTGDAGLLAIQIKMLREIIGVYDSTVAEMHGVINKQNAIIDKLRS